LFIYLPPPKKKGLLYKADLLCLCWGGKGVTLRVMQIKLAAVPGGVKDRVDLGWCVSQKLQILWSLLACRPHFVLALAGQGFLSLLFTLWYGFWPYHNPNEWRQGLVGAPFLTTWNSCWVSWSLCPLLKKARDFTHPEYYMVFIFIVSLTDLWATVKWFPVKKG
jgi:hypothetical protein